MSYSDMPPSLLEDSPCEAVKVRSHYCQNTIIIYERPDALQYREWVGDVLNNIYQCNIFKVLYDIVLCWE